MFFFLVQTEQGDIFKVTMEVDEDMVSMIVVQIRTVLQVSDCYSTCRLIANKYL